MSVLGWENKPVGRTNTACHGCVCCQGARNTSRLSFLLCILLCCSGKGCAEWTKDEGVDITPPPCGSTGQILSAGLERVTLQWGERNTEPIVTEKTLWIEDCGLLRWIIWTEIQTWSSKKCLILYFYQLGKQWLLMLRPGKVLKKSTQKSISVW